MMQICREEDGLSETQMQQRDVVGLYHEEEELFSWDAPEGESDDGIRRIAPDVCAY